MKNYLIIFLLGFLANCSKEPVADSEPKQENKQDLNPLAASLHTKILTTEYEQLMSRLHLAEAKVLTLSEKLKNETRQATILAKKQCLDDAKAKQKRDNEQLMSEINGAVDQVRLRLTKYLKPAAIVNGQCVGRLHNGEAYHYILRNACLNIVNKKINNDGEISGLVGAVSSEALKKGLVSIDCEVGEAHIALLPEKCDKTASVEPAQIEP